MLASLTPLQSFAIGVHLVASREIESSTSCKTHLTSGFVDFTGSGSLVIGERLLQLGALVYQRRRVSAIVIELVVSARTWYRKYLLSALPVFRERPSVPVEDRGSASHRDASHSVILRTEQGRG